MSFLAALPMLAQAIPPMPPVVVTPTPMPAPVPWYKELYLLQCRVIDTAGAEERFMLTLADDKAAITGGEQLGLQTGGFVETDRQPPVIRGQAHVRRLDFDAGDNKVFVRQLFEEGELSRTFLVVGRDAANDRTMGFEHAAGFCTKMTSTPEGSE
jgi:hypothetical protein